MANFCSYVSVMSDYFIDLLLQLVTVMLETAYTAR